MLWNVFFQKLHKLRSAPSQTKTAVHLSSLGGGEQSESLFSGTNTKALRHSSGKEFIHISYPTRTHQSLLWACPLTQNQNFKLTAKAAEFQQWQCSGPLSAPVQFRTPRGTSPPSPLVQRASVCAGRSWLVIAGRAAAVECGCLLPCPETAHQPASGRCVCSSLAENTQLTVT